MHMNKVVLYLEMMDTFGSLAFHQWNEVKWWIGLGCVTTFRPVLLIDLDLKQSKQNLCSRRFVARETSSGQVV